MSVDISHFLPPLMRTEDTAELIRRECPVCPPSLSIKCTHLDGMYVVMHRTLDQEYMIFVCAGHNDILRTTLHPDGVHDTEYIKWWVDYQIARAELHYNLLVEELLAGTLTERLPDPVADDD